MNYLVLGLSMFPSLCSLVFVGRDAQTDPIHG